MFSTLDSHLVPVPPPETVWKRIALDLPPKKPLRQSRPYLGWMVAAGLAAFSVDLVFHPHAGTRTADGAQRCPTARAMGRQCGQPPPASEHSPLRPNAVAAQHSLQLWLIPAGRPGILGLLHSDIPTKVPSGTQPYPDATIAISLEPEGGSPTGLPTGPVLYSGKI
jgi:hypothetical protein